MGTDDINKDGHHSFQKYRFRSTEERSAIELVFERNDDTHCCSGSNTGPRPTFDWNGLCEMYFYTKNICNHCNGLFLKIRGGLRAHDQADPPEAEFLMKCAPMIP